MEKGLCWASMGISGLLLVLFLLDLFLGSYDEKRKFWSFIGKKGEPPEKATRYWFGH